MESEKFVKASDVKEYFKRAIFGADQKIDKWVDSIPAADVRPVVRGEWLETDAYPHRVYCSVCYRTYALNAEWPVWVDGDLPRAFCPNCGAEMKGAE